MLAVFVDHSLPFLYFKIIFYFMCLGGFLPACIFILHWCNIQDGEKRVSDPTKQQYCFELPCGFCKSTLLKSTQSC